MVAVVAAGVAGHVGIVGVDELAFAERDVAVVGAVGRCFRTGRAFQARGFKAIFDFGGREQEVLVREVCRKVVGAHVFDELCPELCVGQADRRLFAAVGRVGVGVDQGAGEVRVVVGEISGGVVVLG